MEPLLWDICCGIFVVGSCRGIVVVGYMVWKRWFGILVCGVFGCGVFVVESLLLNICYGLFVDGP